MTFAHNVEMAWAKKKSKRKINHVTVAVIQRTQRSGLEFALCVWQDTKLNMSDGVASKPSHLMSFQLAVDFYHSSANKYFAVPFGRSFEGDDDETVVCCSIRFVVFVMQD